jgi:hypothetical protein
MDPKAHLQQLHEAAERISSNLVELEIDAGRRLLETSTLEGQSAERWSGASDALTELWRRQGLLEDLLQRADKLRSGQLGALLDSQSIELARAEVPLSKRQLLAGSAAVETCSPDELVLGMSELFNRVTAAISDIGHAWDALLPKLETARRLAREAGTLAADLGPSAELEIEQASRDLDRIGTQVGSDPLSVTDDRVDQLVKGLKTLNDEFGDSAALKQGLEARIFEARELVTRLQATTAEADDARAELLVKIASPAPVSAPDIAGERAGQLAHVSDLAEQGNWRDARRALDEWTAETNGDLHEARRARDCNRAPIDARNQLRALLDAYAVKAKRLGRLEDPQVEPLMRAAHDALYTAPTDLAQAAQLVRSYQQTLSGAARPPEVNA